MRVAIRADAAVGVGFGHLRRCQALAAALRAAQVETKFISQRADLDVGVLLTTRGDDFELIEVATSASASRWREDANATVRALSAWGPQWVVVDHYGLDAQWHSAVRDQLHCRLVAIDDMADRPLDVDLLVDQNWADDHRVKYGAHVRTVKRILGGPHYALLSPEYARARPYSFRREVESIGIFMGGTDPRGLSVIALKACREHIRFDGWIEIATTCACPHLDDLRRLSAAFPKTKLLIDEQSLAPFFGAHDLQVGAGGGATWERCSLGAPTLAIVVADNQRPVLVPLDRLGVLRMVDEEHIDERTLAPIIEGLIHDPQLRQRLSNGARAMVDGAGAARVAREIINS